jgi:hypothetical protein
MAKTRKAARQVRNLKPKRVRGAESRNVKGGFSKISPGDGSTGTGGTINDKIN